MTDHSRADLLRFQKAGLKKEHLATSVWFEKLPEPEDNFALTKPEITLDLDQLSDKSKKEDSDQPEKTDATSRPPEYFWALVDQTTKTPPPLEGEDIPDDLKALLSSDPLSNDDKVYADDERPEKQALIPWSQLGPVLQAALSTQINNQKTDTNKLVRQVSKGIWPEKIPVKTKPHLAPALFVLIHIPDELSPLRHDIHSLLDKMEKQWGKQRLKRQYVQDYPGGSVVEISVKKTSSPLKRDSRISKPWRLPEPGTPILIISDMGLYHRSQTVLEQWIKLGRQFRSAGFKPTVLAPVPEKWLPKELTALYRCLSWDRGSTLNPAPGRFNLDQVSEFRSKARESLACYLPAIKPDIEAQQKAALLVKHCTVCDTSCPEETARKAFLTWLSAAVEVDDVDLRAVRLAAGKPLSVADEVLFWQSELVNKGSNLCVYLSPVHEKLRDQLQQQISLHPNKATQIFNALSSTLKTQLAIDYYEALLFFRHCSELSAQHQLLLTEAEQYTHRFILALAKEKSPTPHEEYEGIHEYSQSILDRLGKKEKQSNRRYSYWWSQWYKNLSAEDKEQAIPYWVDKSVFQAVNSAANSAEYTIKLAIKDNYLELTEVGESTLPDSHQLDGLDQPLSDADIKTNYDQVVYQRSEQGKLIESENLVLKKGFTTGFQLDRFSEQSLQLNIGDQNLRLASFKRPSWAASLQCKNNQVSADLILNNTRIQVPLLGSDVVDDKDIPQWGFSFTESDSLIQSIAEDEYGLYADLNFFGITQRFRWIEPGTFLMGSPDDEPERANDEAQHPVTLTQGYWLADTCVTQQLWQTVMGENPSKIKGKQNPVENVSWLDCWRFIQKLKEQYPALRFTLPSEAQWEYACRAGTTTPFSFGNQIHSEQANFDGNYPYNNGEKSEYRQTTIPVKSLPANPWGLYEMHGNVDEWCQDNGLRDYNANEAVTDPGQQWLEMPASDSSAERPVRGGSWVYHGRNCRSAIRHWFEAGDRYGSLGFRLALGPELQQGGVAAKGRKARFQSSERSGAASKPETSRSGPDFLTDYDDLFRLSESQLSEAETLSGNAETKAKSGRGWAKFLRRNKDK